MNNGLKPSKVTVNIETMPYFSASIANMRISPVTRVILGTPEATRGAKLEISVVGKCGDVEFLKRCDFVKEYFVPSAFNFKNTNSCVIDFDFDSFEYDYAFLNSIEDEILAEVYVLVNYGGNEYVAKSHVALLPKNKWLGLDGEPSVIAAFIKENETVDEICNAIVEDGKINYGISSRKTVMSAVKELYGRLKKCNIIYSRPVGYAANAKQVIRDADEIFSTGSVLATPLEIAGVFVSCARKIGFDTSLIFVRGIKGEISVLCGVYLVKSPINVPVCENADKILALVEAGDMLVVDPSVFAAAQNTSFVMALENTAEAFVNSINNLVCLVDIESAKKLCGEKAHNEYEGTSVKNSIAYLYSSLMQSPVMQFLAGKKRSELEDIPLLVTDFDSFFKDREQSFKLQPLDFNIDLTDFAAIDKHFSSIITLGSPKANQHFSNNELVKMKERYSRFREKITCDGAVTTALSDEKLYKVSSTMAFGKNKKEPYFAFGYVKITDKLTELVSFAPVCLVKAEFVYDDGCFYVKQHGHPIVNKVFIRNALRDSSLGYDSFMKSLMPIDKTEIFDMFENIRMALSETDDRHVYEIIKEAHIVNIDIDDYVLWSNLALVRKKMSQSENVALTFGDAERVNEKLDTSYVPVLPLYSKGMKAVINDTSKVVEGAFTEEKENVLYAMAAKNISAGKSTLVVTDDEEMSQYVKNLMCDKGLSDMTYVIDDESRCLDAVDRIIAVIEKYKDAEEIGVGFVSQDLTEVNNTLVDYTNRINLKHSMGMSLKEAVSAYISASSSVTEFDDIPIDNSIFEYADESKLDNIFERVGELISIAANLCKKSGLEKHTPLKKHPLYTTNPRDDLDENAKRMVRDAIDAAIPVISEYRDVFLDVNEILGFDERDIDSLYKLEKINDLYKLVLSARDVDIPEKFVESDIAKFSRGKRFETENLKRMEAIEFKLNFFSHEIFEDIETILRGEEYDEDGEKGFLKKFMHKKNSQDVLLQYVPNDKKMEFQQHKVSDLYKLLYEYKSCVVSLKNSGHSAEEDEETAKLAKVSEKAAYLVEEIASSSADTSKLLSNVFRLISVIPVDANLARKITVVRARLAELYSGENSTISLLAAALGIDFSNIVFGDGILSFDGFGKYLDEIQKKLDLTQAWSLWLKKANEAKEFVPNFVRYLEEHGACSNVERIFAKSLLSPVAQSVRKTFFSDFSMEKLGKAKDKYTEFLYKACDVSTRNIYENYKKVIKHLAETNVVKRKDYENLSFRELMTENTSLVKKTFPVVVVTKNMLAAAFPFETKFDSVFVIDNSANGFSMLPALAYGEKCTVFNMSRSARSSLCERLCEKVPVYNVSSICSEKDTYMLSWLNSYADDKKCMSTNTNESSTVELVRMNGAFDRTLGRFNKTEAELSMVKAASLLESGEKTVVLTAFTKEQCTVMEKMLHVVSKKNKVLAQALKTNRISVCTPDRLYMKKYDNLVVSVAFGADKDARLGWDFGCAGKTDAYEIPEAYISIADRKTEKTYILTSLNVKDARFMRRTGINAAVFNSLCEMLGEGRVPIRMTRQDKIDEISLLSDVMLCMENRQARAAVCEGTSSIDFALKGISDTDLFILCDNDMNVSLHDELLIKKKLEEKGCSVTTLTPMSLIGFSFYDTIKSLVKDNNI